MNNPERIKHIFQFINFDGLTEAQENLVISFEEQFLDRGMLSDNQMKILEDIYRRAAIK
jgi:hypothetical protein